MFAGERAGTCKGRGDYLPGTTAAFSPTSGSVCAGGGEDPALRRNRLPVFVCAETSLTSADDNLHGAAPGSQDGSHGAANHGMVPGGLSRASTGLGRAGGFHLLTLQPSMVCPGAISSCTSRGQNDIVVTLSTARGMLALTGRLAPL